MFAGLILATSLTGSPPLPERKPMLYGNAVPVSYDLTLAPDVRGIHFGMGGRIDGSETIVVRLSRPAKEIALNAALVRMRVASIDGDPVQVKYFPVAQQVAFAARRALSAGEHVLRVRFTGTARSDSPGLWADSPDPESPQLVNTFEPATARTVFPCFDEPQYRAAFTIHLVTPAGWSAVSNMPRIARAALSDGRVRNDFAPTPPMPTFLLTFDMGKFVRVSSHAGATPVSVYIRPGQEPLARSVLHTAVTSLAYYEHDLGVPFPLPKLDVVVSDGVLNDSEQGYGAITVFTESDVSGHLRAGLLGQQDAFSYVAAPIAMQWFGDLVTQSWWSDAWVTYGLGGYEEQRAERALHPEFSAIPQEIDWSWMGVYDRHSGTSVRRKIDDDRDPAAWQGLNGRTYDVGPAVLALWDAYAGEAAMHRAMRTYLHSNENRSVATTQFWKEFGNAGIAYGHAWLDQFGTPLLRARVSCQGATQRIDLSQQPIRSSYSSALAKTHWPIPVKLTYDGKTSGVLLSSARGSVPAGACGDEVTLNAGLRPPYLSRLANLQSGTSATDLLRVYQDTQFLYDAHLAGFGELNRALQRYATAGTPSYRLRYGFWDVLTDAQLLRGSKMEATFDRRVRAWAVPLEARWRGMKSPLDADTYGSLLQLLSWMPDRTLTTMADAAFRRDLPGGSVMGDNWGVAQLSAQAASDSELAQLLPVPASAPYGTLALKVGYLSAVSGRANVAAVLASASRTTDWSYYISALGTRNPQFVARYLDQHAAELLKKQPPTQKAATLTSCVVNGVWSARSPQAWRAFFAQYLSRSDDAIVADAMKKITINWRKRRELEGELSPSATRAR